MPLLRWKCAPRTSTDVNVCMLTWTDEPYGKFTRDIPISLHPGTEYIVLGHRQECSGYVLRYTIRNKKGHRSPFIHPMCRPHHTNGPVPEPELQPYYPGPLNDIPVNATPRQSIYSVPRDSPVHFHNVSGQFTKAEYTCTGPSFHQAQNLANQRQDRTFQSMRPGELTGHRFVPTDINDITIPTDQNIVISPPTEPPHDKYSNLTGNTQPPFTGTTMHSNLGGYQRLVTRDLESGITPFEQRNVSFPAEQQEAAENSRLYDTSSSWGPPVSNHAAQHPSFGPDYNQGHVLQVPSVPSSEPVYQANPQVAIEVYNPEEIRPCTAPGPATVVAVNPGHYSTDAVHTQDVSMPTAEIPLSPCDVPAAPFVSIQAGASVIDTTQGAGQAERGVCNISAGGDAQGTTLKNLSISSNAEPCGVPFSERDGPPLGTYVSAEAQKGNSEGVGYQPEAAQQSLGPEGDLYIFGSGDKQIESPATTGMPSNLCNVPMDDHLATDTFGPEVVTEPSCHGTVQEQGSSENFASQEAVLFPPIQRGPEPVEAEQIISGPSESGPPMVTNHMPIQAETEAYTAETREMGSSDNTLVNAIVRVVTESTGEQTVAEHAQVQAQEQEYTTSEVRDARKLDELGADAVYAGEAHQVIVDVNSAQDQISTGNSQEDKGAGGNPGREIIKNTGSPQELTDAPVPIDVAQELPLMTANASSQAKEVTAECSDSRIESCVDMQSFAQEQVVLTESTLTTEASESKQVGVEKTYDETLGKTVVAEEQSRDIRETSSTQNFNLQDTPESPQVPDVLGPHSQNAPLVSRHF
ncbi:hypothetical protein K439DRAFT_80950 [Ramaria rubella]|nr:hypothetical protein K439DRAFT_80950 [Ramaria rubella]